MGKLSDMFSQARRARSGGGIGFIGKNKPATKPRAAALVVELADLTGGRAEAAVKAGADGLLFTWNGKSGLELETLKKAIEAAQSASENVICGLHITGGWNKLERENFENFKEQGVNYIVLPLNAPARLLALHVKDIELVVSVPMREGDMYPIFIRNLSAFDSLAAIHLDFSLVDEAGGLSIEDVLHYRAVREAVHAPALLNVKGDLNEDDAYTLLALGVQALVLPESENEAATSRQVAALRELLEKVHHEDKDTSSLQGLTNKA